MPPFLATFAASIGANALKYAAMAFVAAALFGGGYLWGDTHATGVAMEASAKAAQIQVSAVAASYQATINDYAAKLKNQQSRGDKLASELDAANLQIIADGKTSKEKISHAIPSNSACDLNPDALGILRAQAARN